MILRFNENFEAFIDAQYPSAISENLHIKVSDLMNIYTLHRMKKDEPNFFQMEIKNFNVASFFTGFSLKQYVGCPDYAISVIFSDEDVNEDVFTEDFEGMVRRVAYELLTKRDDPNFNEILKEYYIMLRNGDLSPYWEESNEEEINKIVKIPTANIKEENEEIELSQEKTTEKIASELKAEVIDQSEDKTFEERFDKLEKEVLEQEIKTLKMLLKEKSEKNKELSNQLTAQRSDVSELDEWKSKYEKLKEENETLAENLNKLIEISSQQNKEIDQQVNKINKFKISIEEKSTQIDNLKSEIDNIKNQFEESNKFGEEIEDLKRKFEILKRENDKLNKEIEKLNNDNEIHIDNIASLKLKLREFKNKLTSEESVQDNLAEAIIDLKKEIKVLRRERDHYKNIVKEKDLL
jgi:DNA repair exonuclease SbcCD ATPase subunit